jgi:hypothetical protein
MSGLDHVTNGGRATLEYKLIVLSLRGVIQAVCTSVERLGKDVYNFLAML